MKKTFILLAMATVAVAVACSKSETPANESNVKSFTVDIAQLQNGNDTKTAFVLDGGKYNKLVWHDGDKLYVTRQSNADNGPSAEYATYTIASGGNTTGTFNLTGGAWNGIGTYVAFYSGPIDVSEAAYYGQVVKANTKHLQAAIPSKQTYVENGIQQYGMPMCGIGPDLEHLTFYLLGNVIRFNLYNGGSDPIKIKSITLFTSDTGSPSNGIAGAFAFVGAEQLAESADPTDAFGIWAATSINKMASRTINYSCGDGVTLSTNSVEPTVFNVVISRRNGGGNENITARFTYTVGGSPEKTKDIELTNLTQTKRNALGKIYAFPAKDASTF